MGIGVYVGVAVLGVKPERTAAIAPHWQPVNTNPAMSRIMKAFFALIRIVWWAEFESSLRLPDPHIQARFIPDSPTVCIGLVGPA